VSAPISLDQRRAASAYAYAASPSADLERAQKLPMMLQINGLLATWAFLLAKKEHNLLSTLLQHLHSVLPNLEKQADTAEAAFLRWVGGPGRKKDGIDSMLLRALTAEAIAWSVWLKRAAEAHVPTGSPEGDGDGGA
jgi:CRISPR/Cas system CMR-associated protein Cmr5 small subunit